LKENPLAMKSGDKLPMATISYEIALPGGLTQAKHDALTAEVQKVAKEMRVYLKHDLHSSSAPVTIMGLLARIREWATALEGKHE
jgi:hypothetical protein